MDSFNERSDVPIIAFFGTKGGVGKTTITSRFAEFVSYSVNSPNILMIDFDVDHRGLTVLLSRGRGFSCKTIHEYVKDNISSLDSAIDVTEEKKLNTGGKLYLIPSAHADSKLTFRVTADLDYNVLVNTIIELIKEAVSRYNIGCVVIDCGPVINPYTAAAAHIADHAFIIGQNEPISYEALANYSYKIREFFEGFNSSKMAVILNKVRGSVREGHGIFTVIPFTLEVVDISEGLENIDRIRLVLFESYIHDIVSKLFHKTYPPLVPDQSVVLDDELKHLSHNFSQFSRFFRFFRIKKLLVLMFSFILIGAIIAKNLYVRNNVSTLKQESVFPLIPANVFNIFIGIGIIGLIISIIMLALSWSMNKDLNKIKQNGAKHIVEMLHTAKGREMLWRIRKWMERLKKTNS